MHQKLQNLAKSSTLDKVGLYFSKKEYSAGKKLRCIGNFSMGKIHWFLLMLGVHLLGLRDASLAG